jgi:hypothetical protein
MMRLGLLWLALMAPTPAPATTLIPMDFADLTANAELIFVGTVSDIQAERAVDTIYTHVTFADLHVLKGSHPGEAIGVRLMGGSVGSERVQAFGMPQFVIGERSLIFLAGNFRHVCPIVGWGQGRFKIRWDAHAGQEVVFDDREVPVTAVRDREIVRARKIAERRGSPGTPDIGEVIVPDTPESEPSMSLEAFIRAIETRMGIGAPLGATKP